MQIGKTIITIIYIAWYCVFNFEKNVVVLTNKADTTKNTLDKIKSVFEHLPFFLKPGILKNDVMNMRFDNGVKIFSQGTSKRSAIGVDADLIFIDEFAHIQSNILNEFYENALPTISASEEGRVVITSTPNGFNLFYTLWDSAINNKDGNVFTPHRVDWWEVPGRDENWRKEQISLLGSEDAFNRQYGNDFLTVDGRLINVEQMERMQKNQQIYFTQEFEELIDLNISYEKFLGFDPNFDIKLTKSKECFYVFSVDIAEGGGGSSDSSVIQIFELDVIPEYFFTKIHSPTSFQDYFGLKQIARFESNVLSLEDFSKIVYILMFDIFYSENCKLVLEMNTYGGEFLKTIQQVFPGENEFDEEIVVKFKHRNDDKLLKFGLKIKSDNKPIMAQNFKKNVNVGRIVITDSDTISQLHEFGKDKNGNYKGLGKHDDLVMASINVCEFLKTIDFADFVEEKFDMISTEQRNNINKQLNLMQAEGDSLMYDIYSIVGGEGSQKEYSSNKDEEDDDWF